MAPKSRAKDESPSGVEEVVLRFLEGENEGVELRVAPPRELVMGRSEECDIFLGEKKISRKHCKILVGPEDVRLVDLESTNGTFLNSKKVGEAPLSNDDKIRVGTSLIQISISHRAAGLPAARESPSSSPKPSFADSSEEISGVMEEIREEATARRKREEASESRAAPPLEAPRPLESKKAKPLSGNLSAMGLADLLQNLSQNRKSGMLHLRGAREGKIYIVEGKVLAAEVGKVSGTKAAYRMLGWNEGEFELLPLPAGFNAEKMEDRIGESMEGLLMEGFRQQDELGKIRKGLPTPNAALTPKPKFTAPLSKLHPRVLDIFQLVMNEGTFEKVLDVSHLSDLETSKIIFYLLKKEYIVAK